MVQEYTNCMNNWVGWTEQDCATYDECLIFNKNNYTLCDTNWGNYINPNWVSGDCGVM